MISEHIRYGIVSIVSLFCMLVFWAIDYFFLAEMNFSLLYLIPIAFASWVGSRKLGIIFSLLAPLLWFTTRYFHSFHFADITFLHYLNLGLKTCLFLCFTLILSALKSALNRESEVSRTDFLTGIANSRSFYELLENELERMKRYGELIAVAYIDVDNFKEVNDIYGHREGDKLLQIVAKTIKGNIRCTDTVARMGGDEFIILLIGLKQHKDVKKTIVKIKDCLLKKMRDHHWPVTFSFGVISCNNPPNNSQEVITLADKLMYECKKNGKNIIKCNSYRTQREK